MNIKMLLTDIIDRRRAALLRTANTCTNGNNFVRTIDMCALYFSLICNYIFIHLFLYKRMFIYFTSINLKVTTHYLTKLRSIKLKEVILFSAM